MLAKASPLKPYVPIVVKSSKVLSLEVVNLSQRIGKSSFWLEVSKESRTQGRYGPVTDIDAMAVVRDLKQLQPSILNDNLKGSGASIHSIFDQFFQRMDRSDYDLASSDLVDNILIKRLSKPISSGSGLGLLGICYLDSLWSLGG